MSGIPPPTYDHSGPTQLRPYLELPYIVSLAWLAYPILSLLFIAFRLQSSSASANDAIANAKDQLQASCQAAEKATLVVMNLPRYMAVATNQHIADAINGTMRGARAALILALTAMEAIINFIVDLYRSTFLCFLELVVRGALSILIGAVQEFQKVVTDAGNAVASGVQSAINGFNAELAKAVDAVNSVSPFGDISVPQLPVPDLSAIQNIQFPTDFQDSLTKLNSSIPSLDQIRSSIDNIIDKPFELVKADINNTFAGLSFDASTFPVPPQNSTQLNFCENADMSFIDDLGHDLANVTKWGTVLIVLVALLLFGANWFLEWYRWQCMKRHMQWIREGWANDPTIEHSGPTMPGGPSVQLTNHNLLMLHGTMAHPLLTKWANGISKLFRLKPQSHINLSWFFHYVFHPPALACFLIGAFGILSVELQLLAIAPLEHKYQEQATAAINSYTGSIAGSVNAAMYASSAQYAAQINGKVDTAQNTVNEGVFGWVNGTTTTLNDTINAFYSDLQSTVETVFGGTILDAPIQEFLRCFIGSKVDAIENALTFLHDNLVVDLPRVNDTALMLSPDQVNEAVQPLSDAAVGGGNGDSQGVVGKIVHAYVESLKKERLMFGVFLALWLFVVLMALAIIFWKSYCLRIETWIKARMQKRRGQSGSERAISPFEGQAPLGGGATYDMEKQSLHNSFSNPSAETLSPPHPLYQGNPAYGKSWESMLDHVPERSDEHASRSWSPRVTSPRNEAVVDLNSLNVVRNVGKGPSSPGAGSSGWFKPFTLAFWRNKHDAPSSPRDIPASTEKTRPPLTINTGIPDEENQDAHDAVTVSAWSASPGTGKHKKGWLSGIVASSANKHRRSSSVPVSPVPELPMPLFHGYNQRPDSPRAAPPPPTMQLPAYPVTFSTAYPSPKHQFDSELPRNSEDSGSDTLRSMRSPAKSKKSHRRFSSQAAADPFSTPFDDDYRTSMRPSARKPSVGVAM